MRVAKARVVTMEFTLKDDEGRVLETTLGRKPVEFLCGGGAFLPALENALIGLRPGDETTVVIHPSEGHGHKDRDLVLEVTKSSLPEREVTVGQRFRRLFHNGKSDIFRVTGFLDNWVFLNGNHPLAGMELHFEVKILDVRP